MKLRFVGIYLCTCLSTYQLNIIFLLNSLKVTCSIFTLGHMSEYKIIQAFEMNVLNYFEMIIIFIF